MTFKPLHDRVLLRRLESESKTSGGIIIPDTAKEKPAQAEVVSVGTGVRDEEVPASRNARTRRRTPRRKRIRHHGHSGRPEKKI